VTEVTFDQPEASEEQLEFPATLPVLPLKETVVFPQSMTPLAIGQERSVRLIEDVVSRERLLARMSEMRDVLLELNARVIRAEGEVDEIFERAWKMLGLRKILVRSGNGYAVLPKNRGLISYYANSIAHLLGPFERGVRERDALPSSRILA